MNANRNRKLERILRIVGSSLKLGLDSMMVWITCCITSWSWWLMHVLHTCKCNWKYSKLNSSDPHSSMEKFKWVFKRSGRHSSAFSLSAIDACADDAVADVVDVDVVETCCDVMLITNPIWDLSMIRELTQLTDYSWQTKQHSLALLLMLMGTWEMKDSL